MIELEMVIEEAKRGNELPFDKFFKTTFIALQKQLILLTKSEEEAQSIFLEAMEKFWNRFVVNQNKLPKNPKGYIFMICKNQWLMKKRDLWNKVVLYDTIQDHWQTGHYHPDETVENETNALHEKSLDIGLSGLGEKCRTLLELSMDATVKLIDYQERLGYKTYQAMIQAKYNCKKKLTNNVFMALRKLKKSQHYEA